MIKGLMCPTRLPRSRSLPKRKTSCSTSSESHGCHTTWLRSEISWSSYGVSLPSSMSMPEQRHTLRDARGNLIQVDIQRDKRLKKTLRWERLQDGSVLIRVPYRYPRHGASSLLEQVTSQLDKSDAPHAQRTDSDLHPRAELSNRKYFNGTIQWNAIRWVSNMQSRLGSCTRGGPTDGQIRISDKIKKWPEWVLDYVG